MSGNFFWDYAGKCPDCGGAMYRPYLWRGEPGVAFCYDCKARQEAAAPMPVPQPALPVLPLAAAFALGFLRAMLSREVTRDRP